MRGNIFNIQRFSTHDGDGIRTTVFLKGCPLSCLWCHNPEGMRAEREIEFTSEKCIFCGACADVCEKDCHIITDGRHVFDRAACVRCGRCAEECVTGALVVYGWEMTVDDVMKTVEADRVFYGEKGGMTLSGGEPFMQGGFALSLLRAAKERGINTAVETCGYCAPETVAAAKEYTDTFLFDYKATGREEHRRLTGVYPDLILSNMRLLDGLGAKIVLRCPIVPGVNLTNEHLSAVASLANELTSVTEIHIEPYNPMAVSKAARLGMRADVLASPSGSEENDRIISYISSKTGKKVIIP